MFSSFPIYQVTQDGGGLSLNGVIQSQRCQVCFAVVNALACLAVLQRGCLVNSLLLSVPNLQIYGSICMPWPVCIHSVHLNFFRKRNWILVPVCYYWCSHSSFLVMTLVAHASSTITINLKWFLIRRLLE